MQHTKCFLMAIALLLVLPQIGFAGEASGKPEKTDVVVTYAQPSGAFTPIWVAYEAGLFKKYGLNATLQLLTPQVSAQAVISEEADFYTDGPDLINARLHGGQVKYFAGTIQQLVLSDLGREGNQDGARSERQGSGCEHAARGTRYGNPRSIEKKRPGS